MPARRRATNWYWVRARSVSRSRSRISGTRTLAPETRHASRSLLRDGRKVRMPSRRRGVGQPEGRGLPFRRAPPSPPRPAHRRPIGPQCPAGSPLGQAARRRVIAGHQRDGAAVPCAAQPKPKRSSRRQPALSRMRRHASLGPRKRADAVRPTRPGSRRHVRARLPPSAWRLRLRRMGRLGAAPPFIRERTASGESHFSAEALRVGRLTLRKMPTRRHPRRRPRRVRVTLVPPPATMRPAFPADAAGAW